MVEGQAMCAPYPNEVHSVSTVCYVSIVFPKHPLLGRGLGGIYS